MNFFHDDKLATDSTWRSKQFVKPNLIFIYEKKIYFWPIDDSSNVLLSFLFRIKMPAANIDDGREEDIDSFGEQGN